MFGMDPNETKKTSGPAAGNGPAAGSGPAPGGAPRGGFGQMLLRQPRKAVSGIVFSGAVVGMLCASLLFSITIAILSVALEMSVDAIAGTEAYRYVSYLLYQVVYLGLILVYMRVFREKPRAFGYRKTHWRFFVLALVLECGLLFSLNWLNDWFVRLLELIGYEAPGSSIPSVQGFGIVGVLFVVAVLPAFCEETIFRGLMLEGIKDVGTVAACLLGGLLFSVFHQNPAQTAYQFVCGAAFTLLAIRADSLVPAILMHFVNNALIIFDARFGFLSNLSGGGAAALYAVSGVCLAAALVWLIFFEKKTNRKKEGPIRPFLYPALPGIILCGVIWVYNLVVYIA